MIVMLSYPFARLSGGSSCYAQPSRETLSNFTLYLCFRVLKQCLWVASSMYDKFCNFLYTRVILLEKTKCKSQAYNFIACKMGLEGRSTARQP